MQPDEMRAFLYEQIKEYGFRRFCRDAGISQSTVCFWKNGKRGMSMGNLIISLNVLGYELRIEKKRA